MVTPEEIMTLEEQDILQEIMNIAFGKAAADLAEVINIFVVLSVPNIQMINATELPEYIGREVADYSSVSVVEQDYWGQFLGNAFLVFRDGAGKELVSLFGCEEEGFACESLDMLERETLMEVGNILIGACVGKLAELLGDAVSYSPPRVSTRMPPAEAIPAGLVVPESTAIVLKTVFRFNERDVEGFMFLVTNHASITWLKSALAAFMEQYEQ